MKTTIRKGVFETNSSSMHSIVIMLEDTPQCCYDKFVLRGVTYGWEYRCLTTIQDKLDYLWAAVLSNTCEYDADWNPHMTKATQEWKERIRKVLPNLIDEEENYINDYGIDHGGCLMGLLRQMEQDEWLISSYLLGESSHVITSNDNQDEIGFEYPDCPYIEFVKGN